MQLLSVENVRTCSLHLGPHSHNNLESTDRAQPSKRCSSIESVVTPETFSRKTAGVATASAKKTTSKRSMFHRYHQEKVTEKMWLLLQACGVLTVAYWAASTVLLHGPPLYHHKMSQKLKKIRCIAHRGCRYEESHIPENTLSAFQHALDAGVDLIELDVWLTEVRSSPHVHAQ